MAGDAQYIAWVRRQPCAVCATPGPNHAHHHTSAPSFAPDAPRPEKSVGLKRGKSQKAADYYTIPLCLKDHKKLHELSGFFSGYSGSELRAWQDARVAEHHDRYDVELAARGEVPPLRGAPVPSILDGFEPKVAAAEFCSAYELSPQIEHDLERLLSRAVRAGEGAR